MAAKTPLEKLQAEVSQLGEDMAVIARLLAATHGARPELVRIRERCTPNGHETRPHAVGERREAVA